MEMKDSVRFIQEENRDGRYFKNGIMNDYYLHGIRKDLKRKVKLRIIFMI